MIGNLRKTVIWFAAACAILVGLNLLFSNLRQFTTEIMNDPVELVRPAYAHRGDGLEGATFTPGGYYMVRYHVRRTIGCKVEVQNRLLRVAPDEGGISRVTLAFSYPTALFQTRAGEHIVDEAFILPSFLDAGTYQHSRISFYDCRSVRFSETFPPVAVVIR